MHGPGIVNFNNDGWRMSDVGLGWIGKQIFAPRVCLSAIEIGVEIGALRYLQHHQPRPRNILGSRIGTAQCRHLLALESVSISAYILLLAVE